MVTDVYWSMPGKKGSEFWDQQIPLVFHLSEALGDNLREPATGKVSFSH